MSCLCLSDCCRCRHSMSKTMQVISVVDMVISLIYVVYETSNFGMLTGLLQFDRNCSNCSSTLWYYVPENLTEKINLETFTVMSMIVLVFVAFIIEGSLYSKLKNGKRLRIHFFCKSWFEWRLVLLLITVIMAVAKWYRGFYTLLFDGIVDGVTKPYRIITMWCVKCFMKELEETVGVVYVKPPKPRKRGSLSLK